MRCGQGATALGFAPVGMVGRQPQQILQGNAQQLGQVLCRGQHGGGALRGTAHPGGRRACRARAQQPVQGPARAGAGCPGAEALGKLGVGPQVPRRGGGVVAVSVVVLRVPKVDVVAFGDQFPVILQRPGRGAVAHPGLAPPETPAQPGGEVFGFQPGPFGGGHRGQAAQLLEEHFGQRWGSGLRGGMAQAQAVPGPGHECAQAAALGAVRIGQQGHCQSPGQGADGGRQRHGAAFRKRLAWYQPAGWARTSCHRWRVVRAPQCARMRRTPWGCPTARTCAGSTCLAPGRCDSM